MSSSCSCVDKNSVHQTEDQLSGSKLSSHAEGSSFGVRYGVSTRADLSWGGSNSAIAIYQGYGTDMSFYDVPPLPYLMRPFFFFLPNLIR